ncbi:hypothetical protein Btru_049445 [Bulinus truncatus]|nr:hypothetical protein Btru_049445 [Bulinus truncatus]
MNTTDQALLPNRISSSDQYMTDTKQQEAYVSGRYDVHCNALISYSRCTVDGRRPPVHPSRTQVNPCSLYVWSLVGPFRAALPEAVIQVSNTVIISNVVSRREGKKEQYRIAVYRQQGR